MPYPEPSKPGPSRLIAGAGVAAWGLLTLAAVCGVRRIDFHESPTGLYASDDEVFRRLEAARESFGPDDLDLVTLIHGEAALTPSGLTALQRYVESLRGDPAVVSVASPLDARRPLTLGGRTIYLPIATPDETASLDDPARQSLRRSMIEHPALADRFLSSDGRSVLVIATLSERTEGLRETASGIERIRSLAADSFDGLPLRVRVTGAPALRVDTLLGLKEDLLRSSLAGGTALLLIAVLVFRRLGDAVSVLVGPVVGTIWMLGWMGWFGERLDGFNTVLPSLMFAIGFTDSVHLRLASLGRTRRINTPGSVLGKVGPACLYTSLTTALGFGALQLSSLQSVQSFGFLAATGAAIQCLAVTGTYALLAHYRPSTTARPRFHRSMKRGMIRIGVWVADRPLTLSVVGVGTLGGIAFATLGASFDTNWTEALHPRGVTKATLDDIDGAFGGSVPARLIVQWPENFSTLSPEVLGCLNDLESELTLLRENEFPIGAPTSLLTIADALAGSENDPARELRFAWRRVPDQVRRFVAPVERRLLITLPIPDLGAARLLPLLMEIEARTENVLSRYPGFSAHLTGVPVVTARNLGRVARELTASVMFAGVAVVVILGVAFRSVRLGLATVVPNLLPLLAVIAVLVAIGSPLRITTALTLCLVVALGVDDTIHLASSLRRQQRRGATPRRACLAACREAGPPIVLTTLALVAVLLTIALSDSSAIRSFGCLGALSLIASAPSAMVLLPAYTLAIQPTKPARRECGSLFVFLRRVAAVACPKQWLPVTDTVNDSERCQRDPSVRDLARHDRIAPAFRQR